MKCRFCDDVVPPRGQGSPFGACSDPICLGKRDREDILRPLGLVFREGDAVRIERKGDDLHGLTGVVQSVNGDVLTGEALVRLDAGVRGPWGDGLVWRPLRAVRRSDHPNPAVKP